LEGRGLKTGVGRQETEDRRPRMDGNLGDGWRIVGCSDIQTGDGSEQLKNEVGRPKTDARMVDQAIFLGIVFFLQEYLLIT
jgi:hypothetical protein